MLGLLYYQPPVFPLCTHVIRMARNRQTIIVNSEMREECFFMMNIINKTSTFYCNGFACSFIVISDLWVSLIFHIPENRTDNILIPDNEYIMICVINSIDPFFSFCQAGKFAIIKIAFKSSFSVYAISGFVDRHHQLVEKFVLPRQ